MVRSSKRMSRRRPLTPSSQWPFAETVKAGVASVMCSYNMINNTRTHSAFYRPWTHTDISALL